MVLGPRTSEERYGPALEKALEDWRKREPQETAWKAGADFDTASRLVSLTLTGEKYTISHPDGEVRLVGSEAEVPITTRILLLHYLLTADGAPPAGRWVAFRELPDALVYDPAFQGRASHRIRARFGTDLEAFHRAAKALGGDRLTFGDASYLFRALPRVWLAVIVYKGDEEFSPSANVLFDAAAANYLPTEDLAVLGGYLASRLVHAAGK
ncbi:MAG: DUF3786 domain-containing protein [Anaerolineales bacterium]